MTLHILPACDLTEDDGPDVECLVCEDTGEFIPEGSDLFMPCPDCERGEWNFWTELNDDARRGK